MTTYKDVGVDITRAEAALAGVRERIAKTKRPEVLGDIGGFGGLFKVAGKDIVLVATADGVGTKLELARILDRHEGVGTDLVHHCVNDALAMGAEPLFFLDYFSTGKLEPAVFARVVGAMADACARWGCALLGGETAEMPGMYADGVYDIAGFLVGGVERERLLLPSSVAEGDAVVGIPSLGLHTNGYSLARAIAGRLAEREERSLVTALNVVRADLEGGTLADALLAPHRCYLDEVRAMRAVARVRSLAHLTGGGWEGNLPRALADGLGAVIQSRSWEVPRVFELLRREGEVSEDEAHRTWNMGIGLIAIVAAEDGARAVAAVPGSALLGTVERSRGERRVRFT